MSWFDTIKERNLLVCDDNLKALREIPDNSIDLIYLDPPFFSGRNYNVIWGDEGEIRSFSDRWAGGSEKTGIEVYIAWMEERVREMHRILKDAGSFYLHCDHHASHYLKVMCDRVFGYTNFQNDIVWCYNVGGKSKRHWARKHDSILFYSKTNDYFFDGKAVGIDRDTGTKSFGGKMGVDDEGRRYQDKLVKATGKYYRYYLDEPKIPEDWWTDINSLQSQSAERVGYPTQKPLALLERIIKASSNEGDIVLDPFCGGGTTLVAAANLQRRYIGIDESVAAIKVSEDRIQEHFGVFEKNYPEIVNFPLDFDELNTMDPYEFEGFIVTEFGGTPNQKRRGDKGIDGRKEGLPIQVKQSRRIGRNVVDNFRAAIQRDKHTEGYIIAFSFGTGARNEAARLKNEEDIHITLVEAGEIVKINHRPLVEIVEMEKGEKNVTITAEAKDPDKNNIVLWNWYIEGKLVHTDIVCQRKGKDKNEPTLSSIAFKYSGPVKVRVVATDSLGGSGESRKKIGLDSAYRSPSVARVG